MNDTPHSDETRLQPCPFCGKPPKLDGDGVLFVIYCQNQDCVISDSFRTEAEVIEAWNRRPTPPAQPSGLPQTETVKTLGEHALELCWKIEELPASELQTQISIIASELRTRIYTTLGQMGAKVVTSPSQMGAAQPSGLSLEEREAIEKFLYETERTETLHRTHATLGMSPKDRHDVAAAPAIRKLMERVDDYDELQRLADASNAESCDLQEKLTKEVRDHENTVGERDQAEEAISQAYYLVKFADKRFAERGIELTALQHDIAKANRQLTAAQADLLNVRAELERERGRMQNLMAEVQESCADRANLKKGLEREDGNLKRMSQLARKSMEERDVLKAELDRVKGELDSYEGCEAEVSKVYCHITNGRLSKFNTDAVYIIEAHDEAIMQVEGERDALKAELEKCREERDRYKIALGYAVKYGKISGLDRVIQVCRMHLDGLDCRDILRESTLTPPKEGGQS